MLIMSKKEICLNGYKIGKNLPPYFIAEIGINHNGDVNIAKRLIDAAFACGWQSVKFQKRTPDIAVPEDQKQMMRDTPWGRITYLEYKKKIEFEKAEYDEIDRYAKDKPISWSASPWDIPSLDFLLSYDVPYIKIASALMNNDELVIKACQSGKPIILSTGMSTEEEIDHAVKLLEEYSIGEYVLMHTNSVYPSEDENINLLVMKAFEEKYDCLVGYSGHELGTFPTEAAMLMGACVVERHVTLSHEMWGTDQRASIEIPEMYRLVRKSRQMRDILGSGMRTLSNDELEVR